MAASDDGAAAAGGDGAAAATQNDDDDNDDSDDGGAVAEGSDGAATALSAADKRALRQLAQVEVAAVDDVQEPSKMIPDAIEWQLSRMVEGMLDPCKEATTNWSTAPASLSSTVGALGS